MERLRENYRIKSRATDLEDLRMLIISGNRIRRKFDFT